LGYDEEEEEEMINGFILDLEDDDYDSEKITYKLDKLLKKKLKKKGLPVLAKVITVLVLVRIDQLKS